MVEKGHQIQACVDIVYNTDRKESQILIDRIEKQQGHIQLDHSNDIGAGSKKYRLEVIDNDSVSKPRFSN